MKELYDRFGKNTFTGITLRNVMVNVVGNTGRSGWQAGILLGRLVKSGMVNRVMEVPGAKASWAHTYELSARALKYLGVSDDADDVEHDWSPGEEEAFEAQMESMWSLIKRLGDRHMRVSAKFFNDPANREMLRWAVGAKFINLSISATDDAKIRQAELEGEKLGE